MASEKLDIVDGNIFNCYINYHIFRF